VVRRGVFLRGRGSGLFGDFGDSEGVWVGPVVLGGLKGVLVGV
jgi:hypothetical protein